MSLTSHVVDRQRFPFTGDLESWLEMYAPTFLSRCERSQFVVFAETRVTNHHLLNAPIMALKYRVLNKKGVSLVNGVFDGLRPECYDIKDVEVAMYAAFQIYQDDDDAVKRINAARLHLYKTAIALCKVITELENGRKRMSWLYNSYVRPFIVQLKLHFFRDGRSFSPSSGFFAENVLLAPTVKPDVTCDEQSLPASAPSCPDSGQSSLQTSSSDDCVDDEPSLASKLGLTRYLFWQQQKVGRRTTSADLSRFETRDLKIMQAKMQAKIVREEEEPVKEETADSTDDAPCFRVVNSNIRSVEGFARMHIGDSPPPGFRGRIVSEQQIADMCYDIRIICREWQSKDIRGVLLSGPMWTRASKHSGAVLNNALPKAFDGMVVRVISCAKYADSMAAKVRNHNCVLEQPNTELITQVRDEADRIEDFMPENPELDLTESVTQYPDTVVIQVGYDCSFPNDAQIDQKMKCVTFHNTIHNIEMPELRLRAPYTENVSVSDPTDAPFMEPVIKTHMEYKHPVTQQELVYSVLNRSYMPQKEFTLIDSMDMAEVLFEEFKTTLRVQPEGMMTSDADRSRYLQKRGQSAVKDLQRLMMELPMQPNHWFALVKGNPKPTLEDNSAAKYAPTQTIVCKDKLYNHKYGPDLTKIKDFIMRHLKSEYFVYSESDVPTFERKLSRNLSRMKDDCLEIDMSKYDKSQGWTSLLFEMYIFAYFGMSEELIFEWFDSHWYARIKSMTGPTAFSLPAQRKSGDPWTYYGNTLYLMCVLQAVLKKTANYYMIPFRLHYMMLSGDDSLVWGDFHAVDKNKICEFLASDFNLDAKLIVSDVRYFCSRFLAVYHDRVYLIPDPVKTLVKFGRRDVLDRGHVEDMRISLIDHIGCYKYAEIRMIAEDLVRRRYGHNNYGVIMEHLYAFSLTRDGFAELFADALNAQEYAIIVPYDSHKFVTTKAVWHDSLIRKNMANMDCFMREAYMRAIGGNIKRKVLVTYHPKYIPQGFTVIADIREDFSLKYLKDAIYRHSRK